MDAWEQTQWLCLNLRGEQHPLDAELTPNTLPALSPSTCALQAAHLFAKVVVHPVHLLFPEEARQLCSQLLG